MKKIILILSFFFSCCTGQVTHQSSDGSGCKIQSINDTVYIVTEWDKYETDYAVQIFDSQCNSFYYSQLLISKFDNLNIMAKKEYLDALNHLIICKWFEDKIQAWNWYMIYSNPPDTNKSFLKYE